jgi:2-amino-4-hydroxy-6-hydroxymethyldihydropteridine diphosphokinase
MRCGIALGSNIEDRLANLREGGKRSCSLHEPGPPIRVSSIYETAPVDCEPGTMPYLSAVMEINFTGPPVALFDRLLEIERAMGRTRLLAELDEPGQVTRLGVPLFDRE